MFNIITITIELSLRVNKKKKQEERGGGAKKEKKKRDYREKGG